jgi:hypothetical protein
MLRSENKVSNKVVLCQPITDKLHERESSLDPIAGKAL